MAWDVTTEWDDIHRKLGNYEELPVEKSQKEHTKENLEKIEQLGQRNLEEEYHEKKDDDSLDDENDEYFQEYRRKKLEAMGNSRETPDEQETGQKFYRGVGEIDAKDYVKEVNQAGDGVAVLLNFYQEYSDATIQLNHVFEKLSKKYPTVKFLRSVATKCVQNFQDENLPYILYYRDGKMQTQFTRPDILSYRKINEDTIEDLFANFGIPEFLKNKQKKATASDFVREKLGHKKQKKEDFSSDEEEREDKQFISNKAYIRY